MPEEAAWPSPAHQIHAALHDAAEGRMPSFTTEELLAMLGLGGDNPDNRTLLDRFMGDQSGVEGLREVLTLQGSIAQVVELANSHEANEAQEAIASALGAAVTAQLAGKGAICSAAWSLVVSTTREDIIPGELRRSLGADDERRMARADARLRRLLGFLAFSPDSEQDT